MNYRQERFNSAFEMVSDWLERETRKRRESGDQTGADLVWKLRDELWDIRSEGWKEEEVFRAYNGDDTNPIYTGP